MTKSDADALHPSRVVPYDVRLPRTIPVLLCGDDPNTVYDAADLMAWLSRNNNKSPTTNEALHGDLRNGLLTVVQTGNDHTAVGKALSREHTLKMLGITPASKFHDAHGLGWEQSRSQQAYDIQGGNVFGSNTTSVQSTHRKVPPNVCLLQDFDLRACPFMTPSKITIDASYWTTQQEAGGFLHFMRSIQFSGIKSVPERIVYEPFMVVYQEVSGSDKKLWAFVRAPLRRPPNGLGAPLLLTGVDDIRGSNVPPPRTVEY